MRYLEMILRRKIASMMVFVRKIASMSLMNRLSLSSNNANYQMGIVLSTHFFEVAKNHLILKSVDSNYTFFS